MIPAAFTDLQAAAFQCLPEATGAAPTILSERREALARAVCACDQAGGADWPDTAYNLLEIARLQLRQPVPVISVEIFGKATATRWPCAAEPHSPQPWQQRADLQ